MLLYPVMPLHMQSSCGEFTPKLEQGYVCSMNKRSVLHRSGPSAVGIVHVCLKTTGLLFSGDIRWCVISPLLAPRPSSCFRQLRVLQDPGAPWWLRCYQGIESLSWSRFVQVPLPLWHRVLAAVPVVGSAVLASYAPWFLMLNTLITVKQSEVV